MPNYIKELVEYLRESFDAEYIHFEVKIDVIGFNIKVTGQPTVVVQGNKMNAQAVAAIQKAGRGDQITISEIKTRLVGADNYMLPKTSPVIYEVQ